MRIMILLKRGATFSLLFLVLLSKQTAATDSDRLGAEKILIGDLFQNYDMAARPRLNGSETVSVSITYHLSSIQEVKEKSQTISVVGWTTIDWRDDYLTWNPEEYENLSMIVIPVGKIWTPDLVFENSVGDRFFAVDFFRPRITNEGAVEWEPGGPMDLSCQFVLSTYPFDVQRCLIKLVTWANTGSKVFAYANSLDVDSYDTNGGWRLINVEAVNSSYSLDGETYTEVLFWITIRRMPMFHVMNILVPVVLLSVLNLLVFCLPPESGEKVTLSLTVLLAFSVWLLMMNDIMPSTSIHVPVMGVYITIFMCISSLSVLITVMVIRLHAREDNYRLPKWAIKLYLAVQRSCRCKNRLVRREPMELEAGAEYRENDDENSNESGDEISWKRVANGLDLLAFYVFALAIVILTGVVVGDLLVSSASVVSVIDK